MTRTLCYAGGFIFACTTLPAKAADKLRERTVEDILRRPESPESLAEACSALSRRASAEQLHELIGDRHSGVALAAAWERFRRTLPEAGQDQDMLIDRSGVARFIGIVEGRARVAAPPIWEKVFGSCGANKGRRVWFAEPKAEDLDGVGRRAAAATLACDNDQCVVTVGKKKWMLPQKNLGPVDLVSIEWTAEIIYVALYGATPGPYALYAIQRDGDEIRWTTEVWGDGGLVGWGGASWHEVELVVHGDHLLVFGMSSNAGYIEVYNRSSGENIWRFCTSYHESRK